MPNIMDNSSSNISDVVHVRTDFGRLDQHRDFGSKVVHMHTDVGYRLSV